MLGSFVAALDGEARELPHAHQLQRLARMMDLPQVAALFPEAEPLLEMDERAAARRDAKLFTQTLGFLKTQARLAKDADQLAKLAAMSHPEVVRQLLLNPRLTEPLVVRVAARRPARPQTLLELWRSPRWFSRRAVKRALVFNPYLPPEVGAKIVPLLGEVDLRELVRATSVHAALREQARGLLQGPPPPAPPQDDELIH